MQNNDLIYLSVVIPAYNEEKRIGKTLQKLYKYFRNKNYTYEVIIVDDGSKDKTKEILKNFFWENLIVVNNGINRGKGFSVKNGTRVAQGEFILFSDCDLASPIKEVEKLIQISHITKADIILGSRNLKESQKLIKRGLKREIISRSFNFLVRLLVLPNIRDTQCGFKLFSKSAAKKIFKQSKVWGFAFDVEILALACKFGYDIKEVPVKWKDIDNSTLNIKKQAPKMFFDLLYLWKKYRFYPKLIRTIEFWH